MNSSLLSKGSPDATRSWTAFPMLAMLFWTLFLGFGFGCSKVEDLRIFSTSSPAPRAVFIPGDGHSLVAASSAPPVLQVWNLSSGALLRSLTPEGSDLSALAMSPDGSTVAAAWKDVQLWDVNTGRKLKVLPGLGGMMDCVIFAPDGKDIACANRSGSLKVVDIASGKDLFSLKAHDESISFIAFSGDGNSLATASRDSTVKIWNIGTGQCTGSIPTKGSPFSWVNFGPDGTLLLFKSENGLVQSWDLAKKETVREYHVFPGYARLSTDGRTLAVLSSTSDEVSAREAMTGKEIARFSWKSKMGGAKALGLNSNGTLFGVGVPDGTVRVWKLLK